MTLRPVNYGKGSRWRARYVDDQGREHAKGFARKADAQGWLDKQTATIVAGTHVAPRGAQMTVEQWCTAWLEGYKVNRDSTVRQARTHITHITAEFGDVALGELRPSMVKAWMAKLKVAGLRDSYRYALHSRLSQIMGDAAHDGILGRNPCSKRTTPSPGKAKVYCATTAQVWALHDAMPEHLRVAVLLGAFVGLRVAEVSGLRVSDVDFTRGIVHPVQQWGEKPLKTDGSDAKLPIPQDLALLLAASVQKWPGQHLVTNGHGKAVGPWLIDRAIRQAKADIAESEREVPDDKKVVTLPEEFTFHDLRHYLASLLIASGADIKTVQARMRHSLAQTTLDTYGHMWPDADESTRAAVGAVIAARVGDADKTTADDLRT